MVTRNLTLNTNCQLMWTRCERGSIDITRPLHSTVRPESSNPLFNAACRTARSVAAAHLSRHLRQQSSPTP